MIFLIAVLILTLLVFGIAFYLTKIAFNPKTYRYEDTFHYEVDNGNFEAEFFENLKKEEVFIRSDYGYKLHGLWIPCENSDKTIVIVHGYTYTLFGSVKYMEMFLKRGFNVFLYDHRYHGKSGGPNCSMGYYEKNDLKKVMDWIITEKGVMNVLATHGESMGAATVLMHAAIDDRVDFVIADCPFKSVWDQFAYRLKVEYKLPTFPVLNVANLLSKLRIDTKFTAISPIETIEQIKAPVFFIHGDADTYIPNSHSLDMYEKKHGTKKLYLAKGADHARSFSVDRERYEKEIEEFLISTGSVKS
ncbi:MAG TPA: alpha/beta hydrolase [Thermotogota bacterium]|nr:alpha/beta hydrolase [Thermotogota bacterium]HPJ89722.1 alpha/beta hydrolase [Thermotogota bacterium]HPR96945.1 alpha/beta hydrolase [Thermotogota bacterium]